MASKVPAEIHELVPEELRSKYGIYWSSKGERYYPKNKENLTRSVKQSSKS